MARRVLALLLLLISVTHCEQQVTTQQVTTQQVTPVQKVIQMLIHGMVAKGKPTIPITQKIPIPRTWCSRSPLCAPSRWR
jgi:hypothetical protein